MSNARHLLVIKSNFMKVFIGDFLNNTSHVKMDNYIVHIHVSLSISVNVSRVNTIHYIHKWPPYNFEKFNPLATKERIE